MRRWARRARSAAARRPTPWPGSRRWASTPAFIGQVADDQLGDIFAHDMRALGVRFETPPLTDGAADRPLPDPGHARRPADDEHLPRRQPRADAEALDEELIRVGRDHSSSKAICGARSGRARRCCEAIADRPCGRPQGRLHPVAKACASPAAREGVLGDDRERRRSTSCSPTRTRRCSSTGCGRSRRLRSTSFASRCRRWSSLRRRRARWRSRVASAIADRRGAGRARWSTRPAPATCSPPASSPRRCRGAPARALPRTGAIAAAEVISHFGARPEADLKELVRL